MSSFSKSKISSVFWGALLILILLLVILVLAFGIALIVEYIAPFIVKVLPYIIALNVLVSVFTLPVKKIRFIGVFSMVLFSIIYAISLTVISIAITFTQWGTLVLIIGLSIFCVGEVVMAIVATIINGEWSTLGTIVLLIALFSITSALGSYFESK